jgi:recombinational DNA repair ATPase RecF
MPPVSPPPIALTSLKLRDFRGIDSLDFDFRDPDGLPINLVVLAGPNGSGKTAVLEAALILAKAIAVWQLANPAVPADLIHLLAALKARIA